jgi:hypothetical protein
MDDLLKDAIADAKAVRETALENAKIALEEAFTPRLQSMLSKKIQSEMEHEDEDDVEERAHEDEDEVEERGEMRRSGDELDDDEPSEAMHDDEEDDVDEGEHEEDEVDESQVIEIDGVKYAPVVSEEEDEDEVEEGEERGDDDEVDEDLDLDEILKELEEEEDNEDEIDEIEEGEHEDDDKEDVDEEVDQSSGIGSSDNKKGSADKSSGIGSKGKAKHESVEVNEEDKEDEDEVDEDIDLEEIVKALSEEEDEEKEVEEVSKLQSELDEHRNVVKYLRSKLNEVNLLNAKLLFTNKLFRSYGLNNDQKMKVVETFDRAHNLREVKLVYSTLAESFGSKQTKTEIKESKGSASKPVASTKSEKQEVISEGHELRDRFKKLAGIL